MCDFRDYHRTVVAYHGTTDVASERLVNGGEFAPSHKVYEWLGTGAYFWEYAPRQAWWWAKDIRKYARPAVVGAMIRLGNCFDLLDPENVRSLKTVHDELVPQWQDAGLPIPKNYGSPAESVEA